MSTALAARTADHPAVLAGLAPADRSEKELDLAARFSNLSNGQIAKREKRWGILGSSAMFGALASPTLGLPLALWITDFTVVVGVPMAVAATLLGGMLFSARHAVNYANARGLREIRAREDREAQLIADLDERFAVRLSSDELSGLQYPEKNPQSDGTIRYGTIDRMIQDPEGESVRLEQITLVWSGGEFHLLRSTTFEGVREGGLR